MKKRANHIHEVLESEKKFRDQVDMIWNKFAREVDKFQILQDYEYDIIFPPCLQGILRFSNELSVILEGMWGKFDNETTKLSQVLEPFAHRLSETFGEYGAGYPERASLRQEKEEAHKDLRALFTSDASNQFMNLQPTPFQRP
eukprot:UN31562